MKETLHHPDRFDLLFRASEHGFKAQAFHERCDNIDNTLVLIRTEFNKTIGGYTRYRWNKVGDGTYVSHKNRDAFLFQLQLKEKMIPKSNDDLIYCQSGVGPAFGKGDLIISNNCNKNSFSEAKFPSSYKR